jgi:hypothetical protein
MNLRGVQGWWFLNRGLYGPNIQQHKGYDNDDKECSEVHGCKELVIYTDHLFFCLALNKNFIKSNPDRHHTVLNSL